MPDYIDPAVGIPLAIVLWAIYIGGRWRKTTNHEICAHERGER